MRFASLKVKKGEPVFHGTASDTIFTSLKGPAWVAKARDVAEHFARIRGGRSSSKHGGGCNRILEFKAIKDLKLILIRGRKDWFKLLDFLGEDQQYYSPSSTAYKALDRLSQKYDGWIIPTNYVNGDDLLLFFPDSTLGFVGQTFIDS